MSDTLDFRSLLKHHPPMNLPNIEDLTQDQRRQLLIQLLEKNVAGPVRVNEDGGAVLPMNSYDLVQPGQQATITTQVFSPFDLKKIVILEPVLARMSGQVAFVPPSVQRLSGPRLLDLDEEVEKSVDKQEQSIIQPWSVVPRGCWEISAVFLGNISLFGSMGKISGDAFAPDGKLDFASETCQTGICVSLVVQHSLAEAVPFRAVAIGEIVKKKQAPLNPTIFDPSTYEEIVKRMQQPSGAGLLPTKTITVPSTGTLPWANPSPGYYWPDVRIGNGVGGPDDFGGSDYIDVLGSGSGLLIK